MSDLGRKPEVEAEPKGPNLILMYAALALGLLLAMGFAWLVVLPFYHRH